MPTAILGGLAAALLLASTAPAMAAAPVKPLTSAQLRAALITSGDLGDDYTPNPKRNREALDSKTARTKKCVKAIKALKPLLGSKAAVFINEEGKPSGVKQFAISGTPAQIARWQTVGKVMVRDCTRSNTNADGVGERITKLSIGKLGMGCTGSGTARRSPRRKSVRSTRWTLCSSESRTPSRCW